MTCLEKNMMAKRFSGVLSDEAEADFDKLYELILRHANSFNSINSSAL